MGRSSQVITANPTINATRTATNSVDWNNVPQFHCSSAVRPPSVRKKVSVPAVNANAASTRWDRWPPASRRMVRTLMGIAGSTQGVRFSSRPAITAIMIWPAMSNEGN